MNQVLYQSPEARFSVSLPTPILTGIYRLCHRAGAREVGGTLVGYYFRRNRCAAVTEASGPPVRSRMGRSTFTRESVGLQVKLERWWNEGRYYLGEWHSHPSASPEPSSQDATQMTAIAVSPAYSCPEPVLLIIGGNAGSGWCTSLTVFPKGEAPTSLFRVEPTAVVAA